MRDPFRDPTHAALERAKRLEEENERLREDLESRDRELHHLRAIAPERSERVDFRRMSVATLLGAVVAGSAALGFVDRHVVPPAPSPLAGLPPSPPLENHELHVDVAMTPAHTTSDLLGAARASGVQLVSGKEGAILVDGVRESAHTTADLGAVSIGTGPRPCAVGAGGAIVRRSEKPMPSRDAVWEAEESGTHAALHGVAGTGDVEWAVGDRGTVLRHRAGDSKWTREPTDTMEDLLAIRAHPSLVVAVGRKGTLLVRSNGAWINESALTTQDLHGAEVSDEGAWVVGDRGVVLTREASGRWHVVGTPVDEDLRDATLFAGRLVVVGRRGLVMTMKDGAWLYQRRTSEDLLAIGRGRGPFAVGARGTVIQFSAPPSE